jgi:hypothetical protein
MRFFICLVLVVFSAASCKKQVDAKKEDLLLQLIVSTQWEVTKYTKGTADFTGYFSPYSFQFRKDFTVDALKFGVVETTGTWSGSIDTKSVTSNFPDPYPILSLLNGTWLITDSGFDYVESTQNVNGEHRFLRLVAK